MADHDLGLGARSTPGQQIVTMVAVLVPFLGLIAAIIGLWGWAFTWVELLLLLVMYLATGLGITVGYHRLFAHRSFEAVRPVKFALAVLGAMSVQGPLLKWVAIHRRHHQHSDRAEDPHSPNRFGGGVRGVLVGFWHAQIGWMFTEDHPNLSRYVRDLQTDRLLRAVSRLFGVWVLLGLLIPTALGGLLMGTWTGALLGFLWGGLTRIFLVHHVTWSINSICHLWGRRPFRSQDQSRNNFICGVLALGEGWHNNHHAFPASARHGLRWWELDLSFIVIRFLELLGLAWRIKLPSPEKMAIRRV
jgi:stearoyl-CoA desaturase (delta-9 desaturase)